MDDWCSPVVLEQIYWRRFFKQECKARSWICCWFCHSERQWKRAQITPANSFLLLLPLSPWPAFSPGKRAHLIRKVANLWCKQAARFQTVSSLSALAFSGLVNNVATHSCSFMHANITYPQSPLEVISKIITISKWSVFFNGFIFQPVFSASSVIKG